MIRRRWLLIPALILATGFNGLGSTSDDDLDRSVEPGKRFVYKQSKDAPEDMEIYFPKDWNPSGRKVPGVILFHGGGWTGGALKQFQYACHYFASRGLVAATVNYRMLKKNESKKLSDDKLNTKRTCITSAKSAIRWMKQHADELGIDPKRIITGGGSAGGHIAVLATTNPGLNDPDDPKDVDTSVVAYMLFNPAFSAKDAPDTEVDVLNYLKADLPPAIFFFGTVDSWKIGSDEVLKKLKALGNTTAELWIAEGQKHSFFNHVPWQDLTIAEADRFLVKHGLLTGDCTLPSPADGKKLEKAP